MITVKPGWVNTKMIKGFNFPKFMVASTNFVGNKIFRSYKSKKNTLYVPQYWSIIMFIYRMVPEFLFKIYVRYF